MAPDIDFNKGGYRGDVVEEMFKSFTSANMEYWWHFREVLRPSLSEDHAYWARLDGQPLTPDEIRDLIALSLTNYAVYTGIAEAIAFNEQMRADLSRTTLNAWRVFEVRRAWKALYSSLYTSLTALSNIICVLVANEPIYKVDAKTNEIFNWGPGAAAKRIAKIPNLAEPFARCKARLVIRDHLDHYWLIRHSVGQGKFFIDEKYLEKGKIVSDQQAKITVDAAQLAQNDLLGCAQDFNLMYKELSTTDGYLDTYLTDHRKWAVKYSDYGFPHNGQRPKP